MATGQRRHCSHPEHLLLKTNYDSTSRHVCDICRTKLSSFVGYRCNACDFDIHEACADYFKETVNFFAHPWHTLTLCRMPPENKGWVCDLCMGECPPGNFVYRCAQCKFDVHPLCTLLPQTIRSPLHPQHDLNMAPSVGQCSACRERLPVWHYICGPCPYYRLHIGCVSGAPSGVGQGSGGRGTGNTAGQISNTSSGDAQNTAVVQRSRSTSITKFLVKKSFMVAIDLATGGLASPVLDVLETVLD